MSTKTRAGSRHQNPATRQVRYRITRRGWIVFIGLPVLGLAAAVLPFLRQPELAITGIASDEVISMAADPLVLGLEFSGVVNEIVVTLDGRPIEVDPADPTIRLNGLDDGEYVLVAEIDRGRLALPASTRTKFVVDSTPPAFELQQPDGPVAPVEEAILVFTSDDPDANVAVDGETLGANEDGVYAITFDRPPSHAVVISLTDALGNSTQETVAFELALPGTDGGPPVRGVHATGWTWATAELRDPIMDMIRSGLINTVELDLKDEAGQIWYATKVELAHDIGAVEVLYDLEEVVNELHELGVRVVGRLVNFRDPLLAAHAVQQGQMNWVVQTPDGQAFGQYGGFTNPFSADVQEYNIALAEEAASLGVDDILFDYVRRPDAYIEQMVFPQQGDQTPEDVIVEFLAASQGRVHAAGARLGASVFGIAATRPDEIAQDIPRMAEYVDYVAPMVYPSHWGPGEYGVSNPNAEPYDIVYRSLVDFQKQVEGTGATVVSWLQDFSLGIDYGEAEVRAQIEASIDAGVVDFLLWDAATTYTSAALDEG